jgi:4a-hydroxytetrahydrobiopterin dehydratase
LVEGRDAIHKRFTFADFSKAFGWMARIALAAERMDHYPEWMNVRGTVHVTLTSPGAGGLIRRDIELAQKLDQLAAGLAEPSPD